MSRSSYTNPISGIYRIQSVLFPERIYIGSASCIQKRKTGHFSLLRSNKHHSAKLQNHFNKYGENDLVFSILTECSVGDLIKIEQELIDKGNPYFNILKECVTCCRGKKQSPESNEKRRIAMTGKKQTLEARKRSADSRRGQTFSAEAILNMSNAHKGKNPSEETKRKISELAKGRIFTKEHKRNISKAKKEKMTDEIRGKIGFAHKRENLSKETLSKMSQSQLALNKGGYHLSDEHKEKISKGNKGKHKGRRKPLSAEHKKHISEALLLYRKNNK